MNRQPTSNVSVDAITLRYNHDTRHVEVGVSRRISDPYVDQLALPGVTLWEGERLADAVERAVSSKLGLGVRAQGQLTVFDEPARDPRGQTLSVVLWAVAEHPDQAPGFVQWHPLEDVPPLAFDHNQMVDYCRPLLVDRLWRDLTFTRALTGPTFPVSAAVAITRSLTGTSPDRGNLNRRLASVRGLGVSHKRVIMGRGRPGTLWEWQDTHSEPGPESAAS